MKLEEALREIQSLKKKVRSLTQENESFKTASLEDPSPVERMLKMRGLEVLRKNPTDRLFFPPGLPLSDKVRFFEMMKKYSFRLVLRDMIKYQDGFRVQNLTRYCSSKVVQGYCDQLHEMGAIIENGSGVYQTCISPLYSFGPTLEWFIAEVFRREFASPAIYGVSLRNTPSGGDYDVIAPWNQRLVYVEVKSSPPKGIEQSEVSSFFSRMEDILAEIVLFFNDTQLRMKDKLVLMFEEELGRRYGKRSRTRYPVERLVEELFHVRNRLFIINSKKDAVENLHYCLRHYLRHEISPFPASSVCCTRGAPKKIGKTRMGNQSLRRSKNSKTFKHDDFT
ncbi:MAG TPA: hypothetical protein VLZ03_03150 [Thermodesulfobacteriota bacterium]|nr:hypothetical protein [Thermodesulfobacteriota bacterium]